MLVLAPTEVAGAVSALPSSRQLPRRVGVRLEISEIRPRVAVLPNVYRSVAILRLASGISVTLFFGASRPAAPLVRSVNRIIASARLQRRYPCK